MKKILCFLAIATLLLAGCTGEKKFTSLSDFEGTKIASVSGSAFPEFIDPVISNVTHTNCDSLEDQADALSSGEADALALDLPVAKYLIAQNTDFAIFPDTVANDRYGFAVSKGSLLLEKSNAALQTLKDNGTITELESVWFSADESKKVLPTLDYKEDFDGSAGVLRFGCNTAVMPMSYIDAQGNPVGFDLDIVSRIAYEMNMTVEFVPLSFTEFFDALDSGRVDMVGGSMSITEERKKTVDFVGPYYEGGVVLVIKADRLGK